MILTTHAAAGAAIAVALRGNPPLALTAAFLSHFVLDAIPHWHYHIRSLTRDPVDPMNNRLVFDGNFLKDVARTGMDCGIGIILSIAPLAFLAPERAPFAFFGAVLGVLPDFLQLIYYIFPRSPLYYLQWFHQRIHTRFRVSKPIANAPVFQALLTLLFLAFSAI